MWVYVGDGSFFPGVPADAETPISDEDFAEMMKAFDAREGTKNGLSKSGLYKHVPDKKGDK